MALGWSGDNRPIAGGVFGPPLSWVFQRDFSDDPLGAERSVLRLNLQRAAWSIALRLVRGPIFGKIRTRKQ